MTKKKLHETVLELCETHNAPEALTAALSDLTKPKVGGSSNVEDYTCFDTDGNVEFVFCTYHKRWEPVTDTEGNPVFKANEKSKNGFERSCIVGGKQWAEQAKVFNTSKAAIMTDVLDEVMTGAEAKDAIAELETARQTHLDREDGLGLVDKPCGTEEA